MYTETERAELQDKIQRYLQLTPEVEGLLQIGSGTVGYRDIYSDIDLMAGCTEAKMVGTVKEKLISYFAALGAFYMDKRFWSETVLGLSVYFENGISVDISIMPTEQIPIRSNQWRILFSKTENFCNLVELGETRRRKKEEKVCVDHSVHHKFMYALRRCKIAVMRQDFIYADAAMHEARQYLLNLEVIREKKKIHQFKAYNTLNPLFLTELEKTYPVSRTVEGFEKAIKHMLLQYRQLAEEFDDASFIEEQMKMLSCFGVII